MTMSIDTFSPQQKRIYEHAFSPQLLSSLLLLVPPRRLLRFLFLLLASLPLPLVFLLHLLFLLPLQILIRSVPFRRVLGARIVLGTATPTQRMWFGSAGRSRRLARHGVECRSRGRKTRRRQRCQRGTAQVERVIRRLFFDFTTHLAAGEYTWRRWRCGWRHARAWFPRQGNPTITTYFCCSRSSLC